MHEAKKNAFILIFVTSWNLPVRYEFSFLFFRARDFLSFIPKMFNCKNITGALYRVKVGNNADFFNLKLKYVH